MIHFDSSFLVDLLRERRRGKVGPAHEFLAELPDEEQGCVSVHVVCELYLGVALALQPEQERQRVELLLSTLSIASPDETFAPTYAKLFTSLRSRGTTVATMDLLIGTAAVCAAAPLVTGSPKHFRPISDLAVLTYRNDPGSPGSPDAEGQGEAS